MKMFAGLDVGFKRTAVCVVDGAGKSVWRGVLDTHPEAIAAAGLLRPFGTRLPSRQGTKKFVAAAHRAVQHDAMLYASVTALMEALAAIEGHRTTG